MPRLRIVLPGAFSHRGARGRSTLKNGPKARSALTVRRLPAAVARRRGHRLLHPLAGVEPVREPRAGARTQAHEHAPPSRRRRDRGAKRDDERLNADPQRDATAFGFLGRAIAFYERS